MKIYVVTQVIDSDSGSDPWWGTTVCSRRMVAAEVAKRLIAEYIDDYQRAGVDHLYSDGFVDTFRQALDSDDIDKILKVWNDHSVCAITIEEEVVVDMLEPTDFPFSEEDDDSEG